MAESAWPVLCLLKLGAEHVAKIALPMVDQPNQCMLDQCLAIRADLNTGKMQTTNLSAVWTATNFEGDTVRQSSKARPSTWTSGGTECFSLHFFSLTKSAVYIISSIHIHNSRLFEYVFVVLQRSLCIACLLCKVAEHGPCAEKGS